MILFLVIFQNQKYGDLIKIYDNYGIVLEYKIYDIYKVKSSDISCTSQETNGLRIITLVTCDSLDDNYRTIVVAKEK